jgi:hypothetical protein
LNIHYHLAFGNAAGVVIAQLFYDNYEESLVDLSEFAAMMFSQFKDHEESLSYEQALDATDYGDGTGAVVGSQNLCIYWVKCDHCFPPQLN